MNRALLPLALLLALVVPAPASSATIAYDLGGGEEDWSIWTVEEDGSRSREVLSAVKGKFARGPSGPRWSPDGRHLLFGGHHRLDQPARSLWYATAAGTRVTRIPIAVGRRSLYGWDWSPSGRRVTYAVGRFGTQPTIHTVRLDGTGRRTVARGQDPLWSTSRGRIVFERMAEDDAGEFVSSLHVVSSSGGRPRKLTGGVPSYELIPSVSPGGTEVVYTRSAGEYPDARSEWWVQDLDGGPGRRVASRPLTPELRSCAPQWSPDGRLVTVSADGSGLPPDTYRNTVASLAADGTDERSLFELPYSYWYCYQRSFAIAPR